MSKLNAYMVCWVDPLGTVEESGSVMVIATSIIKAIAQFQDVWSPDSDRRMDSIYQESNEVLLP